MARTITPFGSEMAPFDRLLNDWLGWKGSAEGAYRLVPAMDVSENGNHLTVTLELPGMEKSDLDVTLENGVLTVSGEKKVERDEEGARFHTVERRSGSFRRSVSLPTDIDADQAQADFAHGVLTIRVPKTEAVKPRRLTVN